MTATAEQIRWPDQLDVEAVEAALSEAVPGNWPGGDTVLVADQPHAIGEAIVEPLHPHLVNSRIAYLFQEAMNARGKATLAKAAKASAKVKLLSGVDFIITVNWTAWKQLSALQRVALIDHELCHCGRDDEKEQWTMVPHDLEEFGIIVRRWGLWLPDIVRFAHAVKQLELFGAGKDTSGIEAAAQRFHDANPEGTTVTLQTDRQTTTIRK